MMWSIRATRLVLSGLLVAACGATADAAVVRLYGYEKPEGNYPFTTWNDSAREIYYSNVLVGWYYGKITSNWVDPDFAQKGASGAVFDVLNNWDPIINANSSYALLTLDKSAYQVDFIYGGPSAGQMYYELRDFNGAVASGTLQCDPAGNFSLNPGVPFWSIYWRGAGLVDNIAIYGGFGIPEPGSAVMLAAVFLSALLFRRRSALCRD